MTPPPLNSVGVQIYSAEVRLLVDSLLYRIYLLRQSRDEWAKHIDVAGANAAAGRDDFDRDAFENALHRTGEEQAMIFDAYEAFFAAWARLSLIFHPLGGKDDLADWRLERGRILRRAYDLPDDSLLANRDFRNAWMHFDERLDAAFTSGWLGNRQQFVRTAGVPGAISRSVRVIDVESLTFHYRDHKNRLGAVSIDEIETFLRELVESMSGDKVGRRIARLFPGEFRRNGSQDR